ncbi:hypothetical protein HY640_04080, partial [Candidatus Woesearchaeota archaeon]|nr:hypothetical protein [Candidatus Woesearchaeota archaeon]
SSSSTIFGNLSVTGTNRVAAYTRLGSTNVTIISFNFSAAGEQMNVTGINVTINGTNIGTEDIVRVALYNSTKENAQTFNETGNIDLIAWNNSAPVAGAGNTLRYNFSNIVFNIPSSQILLVVVNISSTAVGNRTFNASIEGAADVVTTGNTSYQAITETFVTQRSSSSTLVAMAITGTNRVASTTEVASRNITVISFLFNATGENMNVTGLNITFNGTQTAADIERVGLYNSTRADAGVFNGTSAYDLIQWNISAPVAGRYNFSNIVFNITAGTPNILLVVVNLSAGSRGGMTFNASIEGAADVNTTGASSALSITETFTSQRSSSSTIFGNLSVTGTNRVAAYTRLGSTNVTIISFNFSAGGEQMNVTGINVTINGTVTQADIVRVALYNSTKENAQTLNETGNIDLIAWNNSAPVAGAGNTLRYNFSNIVFNIPSSQILLVVVNISGTATGGNTFNASIEGAADVVTTGNTSYQAITETFVTQRSSTSTLSALAVTGASRVSSTNQVGTKNVTVISFNFTSSGERMNISGMNVTFNGTFTARDIARVGLYNSTAAAAGVLDGSGVNYDLIQWNTSAPVAGAGNTLRYNFSNIGFNVSSGGTNVLLVVVNISSDAAGGVTFNASIEGAADVNTTGGASDLPITETFTSQRSSSSTIFGNLTVTGASQVASFTRLGATNVTVISFNFTATGEPM